MVGYDYRVQDDGGTKYGGIDTSEPLSLLIGQNPYNSNPDINEDDFIFLESSWKLSEVITNNTIDLSFSDGSYLQYYNCLLYTSPSPRDVEESRMPSSA